MSSLAIAIARLGTEAGVTDIVGAEGIYPIDLPQRARPPCLKVNVAGGIDELMLDGGAEYYLNRVSIDCLAETAEAVQTLRGVVMDALKGNANAQVGAYSGVTTYFANFERTDFSDDRSTYRWTLDFFIRWRN